MFNPCILCNASCCKDYLISVTSFDIQRIIKKTRRMFEEIATLESLNLLNFDNDTILECYERNLRYDYILALKSHPCIFLEKNKCKIHKFAPLVCKLYPHNFAGKIAKRTRCPCASEFFFKLKGPDSDLEKYKKQVLEYKKIVAKWNKKKGEKEECVNFLLNRTNAKLQSF